MSKQEEKIKCPKCRSENLSQSQRMTALSGLMILVLGIPIPSFKKEYHCYNCYHNFKAGKKKS